jgi:hypothetical protein
LPISNATTNVVVVEILASARKHGISDEDIRHACNNAIGAITAPDQPDFLMLVGPDHRGNLLEVGVIAAEDDDYVIHAMGARTRYVNMVIRNRGEET